MAAQRHDRVYDSWLSTENQLRLRDAQDFAFEFQAQLRLDGLFFRTLVVPDTAIIDGWYLGQTSPDDLLAACGRGTTNRRLPLEIRCRGRTFEESLATFLRRPDRNTLNDYPLQLLANPTAREAIRAGLRETPVAVLDRVLARASSVPRAIGDLLGGILRAQGVTDHTVEAFVPYWEAWVDAERQGVLRVMPWGNQLAAGPATQEDLLDPEEDLVSDQGREAYEAVRELLSRERSYKSDALNALLGIEAVSRPATDAPNGFDWDVTTIVDWYDRVRMRALACQHDAAFAYDEPTWEPSIQHRASSSLLRAASELPIDERFRVEIPHDFRTSLALMSSERYSTLFSRDRSAFEALWRDPKPSNARRVCELAYSAASLDIEPSRRTAAERTVRVFGQLIAAGAAEKVGGPFAGVAMIVASEFVLQHAESTVSRAARRAAVEYMSSRVDQPPPIH